MDDIYKLAKRLTELYEISYKLIKREVIDIIKNKVVDKNRIEKCLDQLLNIPTDKCYKLLVMLCNYYSFIDKEGAESYLNDWNMLYGDDECKDMKK